MTLTAVIQSDKSVSNIPVYTPQPQKHSAPSSLKDPRISNIVDLENKMRNIISQPEHLASQSLPLYYDALAKLQQQVDILSGKRHSAWPIEKPEKEQDTKPSQNTPMSSHINNPITDHNILTPLHKHEEINERRRRHGMAKENAEFDVMQKMKTLRPRNHFKPYFDSRKKTLIKTKKNGLFQN